MRNPLPPEVGINTLLEDISTPRCKRPGIPLHGGSGGILIEILIEILLRYFESTRTGC